MKTVILILLCAVATSCSPDKNEYLQQPPIDITDNNEGDDDDNTANPPTSNIQMKARVGSTDFTAKLAENTTAVAFKALLPLTLNMSDYNNNEKVALLPNSLPTNATNPSTIQAGDIMLWGSNSIVLFYDTFSTSYSYSRIGRIDNVSGLKTVLGSDIVTVIFELTE